MNATLSVIERLRAAHDDPMWADHAEVSKRLLRDTMRLLQTYAELAAREAADTDKLLTRLGLNADLCRTEGGHLIVPRVIALLDVARPSPGKVD